MLPASMLLDLKHQAYAWYVMVMYLACDTFMERHLTTQDSTFFLKTDAINQGQSGRLTVYVQPPRPQDVRFLRLMLVTRFF